MEPVSEASYNMTLTLLLLQYPNPDATVCYEQSNGYSLSQVRQMCLLYSSLVNIIVAYLQKLFLYTA